MILLVDYANAARARGLTARDPVLEAGAARLRPILMTAISTFVGIFPVAAGLGAGAERRRPLGVAVAGGMLSSTLLTLIVVPVFYTLIDGALSRARKAASRRPAGLPPRAAGQAGTESGRLPPSSREGNS